MSGERLLNHWVAREGSGRAEACLATTFTFAPEFFEQACLPRFLGLDSIPGEGADTIAVIEEEERLAETRVTVLADRSEEPSSRNLRWDLLPIAAPGGLLHAKVSLLIWQRLVRVIIGSANLTEAGYRRNLETCTVFDAFPGSDLPREVMEEALGALEAVLEHAPGAKTRVGPKQRALGTLRLAAERCVAFQLSRRGRSGPRTAVGLTEPGTPALKLLDAVWSGGPPRHAEVVSPFFDSSGSTSAAVDALGDQLAQRGAVDATFHVPLESHDIRTILRAPKTLADAVPDRMDYEIRGIAPVIDGEHRPLHAKVIWLESNDWVAALIGSSNFTTLGLGVDARRGHLEINAAFGARRKSATAKALRQLIPESVPIEVIDAEWEPPVDEEDQVPTPLPRFFADALVQPSPPAVLMEFGAKRAAPERWVVRLPDGSPLLTAEQWARKRKSRRTEVKLSADQLPFSLRVEWEADGRSHDRHWVLNVTEPADLPPPSELRHLPLNALLEALASSRPLPEALAAALERQAASDRTAADPALDPLKRYDDSSHLLRRTRRVSAALAGLQSRLERPAVSKEALSWRLHGPFGPVAIAEGLLEESTSGKSVDGEAPFFIAELLLTLKRVDRNRLVSPGVSRHVIGQHFRKLIAELAALDLPESTDESVREYVERALVEVGR